MPHTYKFADAEQTTVVRDDGATFPWQKGAEPGAVGANLGGFIGEDYRTEGCPAPAPFGSKDKGPDEPRKGKRALKLKAGKGKKGKHRKGKYAQPVDADKHPRPEPKAKKGKKPTKHGR